MSYFVDDVEKLMVLMRRYGATRVVVDGVEVVMPASLPLVVETDGPLATHEAIGADAGRPTDDEMLLWSAPVTSSTEDKE
jgi:hypothetical protein